jgi:hypothetical protein
LEESVERRFNIQPLFGDRHEKIDRDGNPDLSFDSVFRSSIKGFDFQMLLYPFKEELYLPPTLIKLSNCYSRKREIIR